MNLKHEMKAIRNSGSHHPNGSGKKPSVPTATARCPRARRDTAGVSDERERLRTALHGGLGQLLTSISFLASSLRQKLAARDLPEETQAAEILCLTGRAISETQALVQDREPTQTPA
jgi:signal transduction histidine kinase